MEPEDLKFRIEIALAHGRLSQWQKQFLVDNHACPVKYGPNTRLSEKQRAKLFEVVGYSQAAARQHRTRARIALKVKLAAAPSTEPA
ncbi:hypothetical protein FJ938_12710 [Mesorhizobium sp. B2-4-14]|uniref:hypothetical protein n=1 Tax=Mesorhizobium sp. B2-4-14 TaxID=2589935 RepID=UPI001126B113|nr:hypothetical protein [Mesorhizobium sp. B2-4-14]TPL06868.1 hypothetical protein FJ938_12710 [Mesorhizobium sp. B2-4-14]